MVKTRHGKTTQGINAQVFVAGECAYTAQATYSAFIANLGTLADGEIGVFLESGALKTTALVAGERFFVAQKITSQSGSVSAKKSIIYTYGSGETKVTGFTYSAPIKPVVYVGFNGTSGSLNAATIAINGDYGISLHDTTPAVQPIESIQASRTIAGTTETIYSILGDGQTGIIAQLNQNQTLKSYFAPLQQGPKLYVVDLISNGTYTAAGGTTGNATLTNESATVTFATAIPTGWVIGDIVSLGSTGNASATNSNLYKIAATTATTITLDRPYSGASATVSQANATAGYFAKVTGATEYGVKITTKDFYTVFRPTVFAGFASATITYAVNWNLGTGTPEWASEFEVEGHVFNGGGATLNTAFASDYGIQKFYTNLARAYGFVKIEALKSFPAVDAPNVVAHQRSNLFILAPYAGATFTLGGTLQTNGFSAIANPQTGISAATASPIVSLATVFPNVA